MDRRAYNPDLGFDWEQTLGPSPLSGGFSSWTNDYTNAQPTSLWGGSASTPMDYSLTSNGGNPVRQDYGPSYSAYNSSFDPLNAYSSDLIFGRVKDWLGKNYPQYDEFGAPTNVVGGTGGGGNVSKNPSFGQFSKDPKVFGEIEAAAAKYGIPANLLKAMINRESSGDWQANSHATYLASRGERIVGYTGIMESTAKEWGYDFNALIGNRALQIDAMANGLQRLYQQVGGQYGWDGVISTYYSGKPDQSYTPADSTQYGSTPEYVSSIKAWWTQEDAWTKMSGGVLGALGGNGSISSPATPGWQPVNRYDPLVQQAAAKYGVPPNLVKSVMRFESNGDPRAVSPQGATGLMQIMPGIWNGGNQSQLFDPAYNIDKGAMILKQNYDQYGSWEMAAKAYLGLGGADAHGTTSSVYWDRVSGYWKELDGTMGAGSNAGSGSVMPMSAVWGNIPGVNITQNNLEVSDWVLRNTSTKYGGLKTNGRGMYDYAVEQFGQMGHPGVDYGMSYGTKIYSPVGGTVILNGGTGFYSDDGGGIGEVRIRLDNGHELIFGHMASSNVQVGQRITAGTPIGGSGTAGSGAHLHLEYRVPNPTSPSGWASVDPAMLTTGGMTVGAGVGGGWANQGQEVPERSMSFQEMIIANMQGRLGIGGTGTMSSGNGWNDWVYDTMYAGR